MKLSPLAQQHAAIQKLKAEGTPDIVSSIESAIQFLQQAGRTFVSIVLEGGIAKHTDILESFKQAHIPVEDMRAWSRGDLPGVTVYEITKNVETAQL